MLSSDATATLPSSNSRRMFPAPWSTRAVSADLRRHAARRDGSANVSHIVAAARSIGARLTRYAIVIIKSTAPVGTADRARQEVRTALSAPNVAVNFDIVSNPGFLKEGAALEDFVLPDRVSGPTSHAQRNCRAHCPSHSRATMIGR